MHLNTDFPSYIYDEYNSRFNPEVFVKIKGSDWSIGSRATVLTAYGHFARVNEDDNYGRDRYLIPIKGKRVYCYPSQLVADHFLPPRPTDNHRLLYRDGDSSNCQAWNLTWVQYKKVRDTKPEEDFERFIKPTSIYAYF